MSPRKASERGVRLTLHLVSEAPGLLPCGPGPSATQPARLCSCPATAGPGLCPGCS